MPEQEVGTTLDRLVGAVAREPEERPPKSR
jgi:hypothetical protein